MLKVKVYNQEGAEVKDLELNEAVFGIEPNKQALFDMVLLQRASLRQGTHKVKNRTEVSGGGKKPWRQKGTGRARQGSDVYKRQGWKSSVECKGKRVFDCETNKSSRDESRA